MPLPVQVNGIKGVPMSADSNSNKKQTDNISGYDRWSLFYDRYPNPTVAIDELSFPSVWRESLRGQSVLEIGCGTGRHTEKLMALGNHVTALDASRGMLDEAKKKITASNVQFIEGDFLGWEPSPSEAFDAAIMSLVLEHMKEIDRVFQKISSVLKAHGQFFLSEIHPARTAKGILAHFRDESGEEIHLQSHPHSEESIRAAAEIAGFRIERKLDVLGTESLAGINPKWSKHIGSPMIQIWIFEKN